MRPPKTNRTANLNSSNNSWSISQGDYQRESYPGEKSFQNALKVEKRKKTIITIFLLMMGYGVMILVLSFLTKS